MALAAGGFGNIIICKIKKTAQNTSHTGDKQATYTQTQADPYKGWKSNCDASLKACYKYPNNWVQSQYGGWQNIADTAYFNIVANNKDQSTNTIYVAAIEDLVDSSQGLKIVGTVENHLPSYTIYDASIVTDKHLVVGQTAELVTTNPTFKGKGIDKDITFNATPGTTGIASITNAEQAKAWFATPDAQQCLKILQSFKYL